jgi:hypothetical protein
MFILRFLSPSLNSYNSFIAAIQGPVGALRREKWEAVQRIYRDSHTPPQGGAEDKLL